jgi:DNA polymerase I-like protein with 3'-5' exonuclease and polymerase domains
VWCVSSATTSDDSDQRWKSGQPVSESPMRIITIDFETFYSREFSLSKMTTEEYIRSPDFEVIGVAVKVDDEKTVWFSGTKADTAKFLRGYDWDNSVGLAHNAVFDFAILNWHFNLRPKKIADTLSMSRAIHGTEVSASLAALVQHYSLGEKGTEVLNALGKKRIDFSATELEAYGEYCRNDVNLTYRLFECLAGGFPTSELNLIDLTIRMFTEPVLELDVTRLKNHLTIVQDRKEELLNEIDADKDMLMSNPKFAEILKRQGVEPPTKISATTGKETFAFSKSDEEFKALLEHNNTIVQALVAARLGVKSTLEETRTERFIAIAGRGKLPIPLRYYAAHTGRWGGDDKVNMQNLPRTSPLKNAIFAPQGYMFIDSDSSQIEARTLAWLAEQNDLVDAFERGEDVYKIMASAIYGKAESEVTKEERFVGKTTILGAGYGMGPIKFKNQLKVFGVDLPQEECQRIIRVYRETYPRIPQLWRQAGDALVAIANEQTAILGREGVLAVEGSKGIRLPNNLFIKYPNLRRWINDQGKEELVYDTKKGKAVIPNRIYGGKVIENVCQALARIVIGEQMLRVAKKYKVAMTVHDAIGCIVPEHEAQTGREYVEMCMRLRPTWALDLPLNCESGVGRTYGDC